MGYWRWPFLKKRAAEFRSPRFEFLLTSRIKLRSIVLPVTACDPSLVIVGLNVAAYITYLHHAQVLAAVVRLEECIACPALHEDTSK